MTEESNTADIGALNSMIAVLNDQLSVTIAENIQMILSGEKKKVGKYTAEFTTDEIGYNAFGMTVAADDGMLYCFTLAQKGKFTLFGKESDYHVEIFDNGNWKTYMEIKDALTSERGCVYRIKKE